MKGKPKKSQREKDLTSRYLSGGYDEDRAESSERFNPGNKHRQQEKIIRTAQLRVDEQAVPDIDTLPIGQVVQVHSLFCDVEHEGKMYLASVRRTLTKISGGYIVVGDRVRFRAEPEAVRSLLDPKRLELALRRDMSVAVVEQVLPRHTLLTRADSFKGVEQHPIVANAQQMLIVASLRSPKIKWGLIDRMLIAAQGGGLQPILCINKIDLTPLDNTEDRDLVQAAAALAHYQSMGIVVLHTSAETRIGLDALREQLANKETVLAGHSGVGKSSLINTLQPSLDIRVGDLSGYTGKGRHTTTSARRYPLQFGGAVIDTPGVKLFGLWGVTAETLGEFFPDVEAGNAPPWRVESYERIKESLA